MCDNLIRDTMRSKDILSKLGVTHVKEKIVENYIWLFDYIHHKLTNASLDG